MQNNIYIKYIVSCQVKSPSETLLTEWYFRHFHSYLYLPLSGYPIKNSLAPTHSTYVFYHEHIDEHISKIPYLKGTLDENRCDSNNRFTRCIF